MKALPFATLALLVPLSATAAWAVNPNVPSWSPYAIMAYDHGGGRPLFAGHPGYAPSPRMEPMEEGRAAYVYGGPPQYGNPGDWAVAGLSAGNTGDYSDYF
jgi:hypothetical protein